VEKQYCKYLHSIIQAPSKKNVHFTVVTSPIAYRAYFVRLFITSR